jgi:hypothetical protein
MVRHLAWFGISVGRWDRPTLDPACGNPWDGGHRSVHHPALGQRIQEEAAITLGEYAPIENHRHASIALAANQTPETLSEAQDGLRDGVVIEAIFEDLAPGREDGIGGNGKGKPNYHHAAQGWSYHVDPFPKAPASQENRPGQRSERF